MKRSVAIAVSANLLFGVIPVYWKLLAGVSNGAENEWMTFRALADGEIGNNHLQLLLKYFDDEGREGVKFGVRAAMRRENVCT